MTRGSTAVLRAASQEASAAAPATPREAASLTERRVETFLDVVGRALADEICNRGVQQADVAVRIDLLDRPGRPLHLLWDRAPAEVKLADAVVRHDVALELRSADLECFFKTGQDLPLRILSGEIKFEGCVRKVLRVLPILRAGAERATAAQD